MIVQEGHSSSPSPEHALAEITKGWDETPEVLFAFCSPVFDAGGIAQSLNERYPEALLVGCTTAGEHISGQHLNHSLVVAGLSDTGIRWEAALIQDLADFSEERASDVARHLFEGLSIDPHTFDPQNHFCLLFVDGLSRKEEHVASLLADAIEGIPLAGGSAGDDLLFQETQVLFGGEAFTDAAVVVMGTTERTQCTIVKHQHFTTTPSSLVITHADPETRTVYEMNGYPAVEAYAGALGMHPEQLTDDITFNNPVVFRCDNKLYVRSIQTCNDDQSITFYCGIEEGMVLNIGGHTNIVGALESELEKLPSAAERADFVLGFNCILRSLEAKQKELHPQLSQLLQHKSKAMIGFDTYGEQLDGLHINQTLVMVAFGEQQPTEEGTPQ